MVTIKQSLLPICLFALLLTACGPKDYFDDMPTTFKGDSLQVLKEVFTGLKINHLDDNIIELRSPENDLLPFIGILEVKDDTMFYRQTEESTEIPFLKLTAPKFDTLRVKYSDARWDDVVAMGKMYDELLKDSLTYFNFRPVRRTSSYESIYLKSIALVRGGGIKYMTFGKEHYDFTIQVLEFPIVVSQGGTLKY